MAATVVDNVKIKVLSTGTGALQLGSAADGYRGREALTNGLVYNYSIRTAGIYEIGQGTYLAETQTLTRSVLYSSNGNSLVTLPPNTEVSFVALAADLNGSAIGADAIAAANTATEAAARAEDTLADINAIAAPLGALPSTAGAGIVGTLSGLSVEEALADRVLIDDLASSAADKGPTLIAFTAAGLNAANRNVQDKLRETRSIGDYVSHAAAQVAAVAAGIALTVAAPATSALANKAAVTALHRGDAQITLADGNKLGKQFSRVSAQPSGVTSWDSADTAFNGDLRFSLFQHEHHIDAGALPVPTSGYLYCQPAAGFAAYLVNRGGGNTSTSSNEGRTSANYFFVKVDQYGGGDAAGLTVTGFCLGAGPVGATSWLAMPATVALNGTHTMGGHARYANFIEGDLQLQSYDAAAIGMVANINRSVGDTVNGLGSITNGFRAQSKGSYAVDSALSGAGLFKTVIDGTPFTLTAAKAFAAMTAGSRLYGNALSTDGLKATSYGTDWLERSVSGFWNVVYNNTSCLQVNDSLITAQVAVRFNTRTTSALPAAGSYLQGAEFYVTDASATTPRSLLSGGGSNFVKVYCDGAAWRIGF